MASRSLIVFFLSLLAFPLYPGAIHTVAPAGTGPMPFISSGVSVAFGPDGGIAVWRIGANSIWGVPLDTSARPTGLTRRIFSDDVYTVQDPSVVYRDGGFELWWMDGYARATHTARLTEEAELLERRTLPAGIGRPSVWNASTHLALVIAGYDLTVQFLDHELDHLHSIPMSAAGWMSNAEALVLDDGSFAVLTSGSSGLYLTRFSPEGNQLPAPLLIEPANRAHSASAATDGESILVVWSAGGGQPAELKSAIVLRDDSIIARKTIVSDQWQSIPTVTARWAGGVYTTVIRAGVLGVQNESADLYALRFDDRGEVAAPVTPIVVRPGLEARNTMASAGDQHHLIFLEGDYGMEEVFVVSIPSSGSFTRPDADQIDGRISDSAAWQTYPVAASDGSGWLAAWVERTATREEIRSAPLGPDGAPTAPPIVLASVFRWIGFPLVAFNGVDFVVAWIEGASVLAKRIRPDGTPVDEQPIVIRTDGGLPGHLSIAARNGLTLLAWSDGSIVRGALLDATANVSPELVISPEPYSDSTIQIRYHSPIASAGSSTFMVAWTKREAAPCYPCEVSSVAQARLVSREGAALHTPVTFEELTPFRVASAGDTHLIAFREGRASIIDGRSGEASPPFTVGALTESLVRAFAWNGEYAIAFSSPSPGVTTIYRIGVDGTPGAIHRLEIFQPPVATSEGGDFLTVATVTAAPHSPVGATALAAEVEVPSAPIVSPSRRRAVRR